MVKELDKQTFWLDPKAGHKIIDAYNELCKAHNDLCQAHDLLVEEFKEVNTNVYILMDAVFEGNGPADLDS